MNRLYIPADPRAGTTRPRTCPPPPIAPASGSRPLSRSASGDGRDQAYVWHRIRATIGHLGELMFDSRFCREISWRFSPRPSSVGKARRLARSQLVEWGADGQSGVAELLVSELVTNALCHAYGTIRLTLSLQEGLLRCEVEDSDSALPYVYEAATTRTEDAGCA
ncbi:ATP-binding protein [Streptosporangium lutulentum]